MAETPNIHSHRAALLELRDLLRTARASDVRTALSEAVAHALKHGFPDVPAAFLVGFLGNRAALAKAGAR